MGSDPLLDEEISPIALVKAPPLSPGVGYRFFAVPGHCVVEHPATMSLDQLIEPEIPTASETVERALSTAEFRNFRARDRLRQLLTSDQPPTLAALGEGFGPGAVFARPPDDLPALLRLADHLVRLTREQGGERALIWKCECGTRFAVPTTLVREVSIRCEKCSRTVEMTRTRSAGEESLQDPYQGMVNRCRRELAAFFREAMARGWPVLVCTSLR